MRLFRRKRKPSAAELHRMQWRELNPHNNTRCGINLFDFRAVSVGKHSYGDLHIYCWDPEVEKLVIGNYCSIAEHVTFLLGGNHKYDCISTFPFKVLMHNHENEAYSKGHIILEDDVWIGLHAMILSGVRIGQGAIVAAGSVVANDVPPYSIVAGNPAKVVKKRFSDEIIEVLLQLDFSLIDFKKVPLSDLYQTIKTKEDAERIVHLLQKYPTSEK